MNCLINGKYSLTDDELMLTFREAQDFLRISATTMYRLLASGVLKGHKIGTKWRFYLKDLRVLVHPAERAKRPTKPADSA
jgi:excisionase family DNA binding protein